MDISGKYAFYIATARGIVGSTTLTQNEKFKYDTFKQASEITCLEWGRADNEIIVGFKDGNVSFFDTAQHKYVKTIPDLEGSDAVVGIGVVNKSVLIGRQDGIVNIWRKKQNDFFSINLDDKGTMDCMKYHENREGVVATGGEFNDLKLWNVETKQCLFKAKSMGHDELNLPIPTSVRGICFFSENEHLTCVATKEGQVLLYDDRAQRRPVVKFSEAKASYTTISSSFRERQCLVGTTKGYMQLLDMKVGKCLRTYTNLAGSVTSIACDPLEPIVACTSLDRYFRVFNLETKQLISKKYMKQNLTKMLMRPVVKKEEEAEENPKESTAGVDEEYEELFNNMKTVIEKKHKRKSKHISSDLITKKKKQISQ